MDDASENADVAEESLLFWKFIVRCEKVCTIVALTAISDSLCGTLVRIFIRKIVLQKHGFGFKKLKRNEIILLSAASTLVPIPP